MDDHKTEEAIFQRESLELDRRRRLNQTTDAEYLRWSSWRATQDWNSNKLPHQNAERILFRLQDAYELGARHGRKEEVDRLRSLALTRLFE